MRFSHLVALASCVPYAHSFLPPTIVASKQSSIPLSSPHTSSTQSQLHSATRESTPSPLLLAGKGPPPVATVDPPGGNLLTLILVGVWYAASVVCNQTSKVLVASLGAQTLTLLQMVVAVGCGAAILLSMRAFCALALGGECSFRPVGFGSAEQLIDTTVLAAVFTGGFITLNACLTSMHVSLVMVLRAASR